MATEYWKANKDIHDKLMELIGKNHPDLAICAEEIVVFFREKASSAAPLGTAKKAQPLHVALYGETLQFLIELPADTWEDKLDSRQQEALLDYHLTACRAEEDPKSGETKYSIAKPDVMLFRENFERYGLWQPKDEEGSEEEDDGEADLVDALMGSGSPASTPEV